MPRAHTISAVVAAMLVLAACSDDSTDQGPATLAVALTQTDGAPATATVIVNHADEPGTEDVAEDASGTASFTSPAGDYLVRVDFVEECRVLGEYEKPVEMGAGDDESLSFECVPVDPAALALRDQLTASGYCEPPPVMFQLFSDGAMEFAAGTFTSIACGSLQISAGSTAEVIDEYLGPYRATCTLTSSSAPQGIARSGNLVLLGALDEVKPAADAIGWTTESCP